jgi:hypothetical protein
MIGYFRAKSKEGGGRKRVEMFVRKIRVALLTGLAIGVAESLRFHLMLLDALAGRFGAQRDIRLQRETTVAMTK